MALANGDWRHVGPVRKNASVEMVLRVKMDSVNQLVATGLVTRILAKTVTRA